MKNLFLFYLCFLGSLNLFSFERKDSVVLHKNSVSINVFTLSFLNPNLTYQRYLMSDDILESTIGYQIGWSAFSSKMFPDFIPLNSQFAPYSYEEFYLRFMYKININKPFYLSLGTSYIDKYYHTITITKGFERFPNAKYMDLLFQLSWIYRNNKFIFEPFIGFGKRFILHQSSYYGEHFDPENLAIIGGMRIGIPFNF